MWNLPRPGIELVFPALAGRLLTTGAPGESLGLHFSKSSGWYADMREFDNCRWVAPGRRLGAYWSTPTGVGCRLRMQLAGLFQSLLPLPVSSPGTFSPTNCLLCFCCQLASPPPQPSSCSFPSFSMSSREGAGHSSDGKGVSFACSAAHSDGRCDL